MKPVPVEDDAPTFFDVVEEPLRQARAVAGLMTEVLDAIGRDEPSTEQMEMLRDAADLARQLTSAAVDGIASASLHSFDSYEYTKAASR